MEKKVKLATDLLVVIKSTLQSRLQKTSQARLSLQKSITTQLSMKHFKEAYKQLPAMCAMFEHELALNHLFCDVQQVSAQVNVLLLAKSCPPESAQFIAPLCYAQKILQSPQLSTFIQDILGKSWSKSEIEALSNSQAVPEIMVRLQKRSSFTLEELHTFAHRFEKDLKMDFTWLYENFPVTNSSPPETKVQATILGRTIATAQPVNQMPQVRVANTVPPASKIPAFHQSDFENLTKFVDEAMKRWNLASVDALKQ